MQFPLSVKVFAEAQISAVFRIEDGPTYTRKHRFNSVPSRNWTRPDGEHLCRQRGISTILRRFQLLSIRSGSRPCPSTNRSFRLAPIPLFPDRSSAGSSRKILHWVYFRSIPPLRVHYFPKVFEPTQSMYRIGADSPSYAKASHLHRFSEPEIIQFRIRRF